MRRTVTLGLALTIALAGGSSMPLAAQSEAAAFSGIPPRQSMGRRTSLP